MIPKNNKLGGLPSMPARNSKQEVSMPALDDDFEEIVDDDYDEEYELEGVLSYEEEDEIEGTVSDPLIYHEEEDEDKYIDKKKKKILPIGTKQKTKKGTIKASDFDDRKNTLTTIKILRTVVMVVLVFIALLGLKNTFMPSNNYTRQEIEGIATNSVGQTGFPKERGQAFAEDFISAYLTINPESKANRDVLAYFYSGGRDSSSIDTSTIKSGYKVNQVVIGTPRTYEAVLHTSKSAVFNVSALVSNLDGVSSTEDGSQARWLAFSVNVYYDKNTDQLSIVPNNPTLIPKYNVSGGTKLTIGGDIGNGVVNNDMVQALTPTVDGFIQAYATSSLDSHNEILQYVPKEPDIHLYSGFNGSVKLASESNSIDKVVYDTDNEGEYRVLATVKWVDSTSSSNKETITYTSQYVMSIQKTSEGKYVVLRFRPYVFLAQ